MSTITLYRGEAAQYIIPVQDSEGNPIDVNSLTDICLVITAGERGRQIMTKTIGEGLSIVDADGTDDGLLIDFAASDTANVLRSEGYKYWAWGTGNSGPRVLKTGNVTIGPARKCS